MTDPSTLPYRPCVGIVLIDGRGRVFVGRRADMNGEHWQLPQGGIDPGETPADAALRELEEEAGTSAAEIVQESSAWHAYDLPPHLVGRVWGGRYRGQTQRWFLLRFTGSDDDIDLTRHHQEFDGWRWVEPEALPDLVVSFKRPVYEAVLEEFRDAIAAIAREHSGDRT